MTDAALVDRARTGDRDAFAALYKRYKPMIAGYVGQSLGRCQQDVEDVTSETFLLAWQAMGRYETSGKFSAWLYQIARNLMINRYRQTGRRGHEDELLPTMPIQDRYQVIEKMRLAALLDEGELTPEQRQVLWLRYAEDCDLDEIADRLHVSNGAVRGLDFRAKLKLRGRTE